MKKICFRLMVGCLMACWGLLSSCSGSDYVNAIPANSTAVISVDMQKMAADNQTAGQAGVLKTLLHVEDVADCGIDISEKLYLFESAEGNLGLCAKVADGGNLEDWLNKLSKEQHACQKVTEKKGFHFTLLKDSWLVGFSDKSLLVMGPVVADAKAELQRQMVKYLKADEEQGFKVSPMFGRLDSISSPMAMVAQAKALPEKFVAPFTLGAPKDADASQVVVAAEMEILHGMLRIKGETFSFNASVDKALKEATQNYRPIKGKYVTSMPDDAVAGIFMNVDGTKFLSMVRSNKGLQQLLLGINAAIDMDNIIKSVDGDLALVMPSFSDSSLKLTMAAQLAHSKWLADVGYWKESCPAGSSIGDCGKNAYYYTDGKTSFYFGVSDGNQFYSGSDELLASYSIKPSNHPIAGDIRKEIIGQKLAMVINLAKSGTDSEATSAVTSLLAPIFGDLNSVVYTLK